MRSARLVLSTVSPYQLYGNELQRRRAASGRHGDGSLSPRQAVAVPSVAACARG